MNNRGFFLLLLPFIVAFAWAAEKGQVSPTETPSTLEEQRKQLEIERLQLENERLKFELEKAKAQTPSPASRKMTEPRTSSKEDLESYQTDVSKKAEGLAQENREQPDLLVLDMVNAEFWHHGVRYSLHEIYDLAQDMKWPLSPKLAARSLMGYARNLYRIRNFTLLRYDGRDRGIVEITSPAREGEFRVLTAEGITWDSSLGDVRNAYQNQFFNYDGQGERHRNTVLRYKHSRGLNFSDRIEFEFDVKGRMIALRYGVLDEK